MKLKYYICIIEAIIYLITYINITFFLMALSLDKKNPFHIGSKYNDI